MEINKVEMLIAGCDTAYCPMGTAHVAVLLHVYVNSQYPRGNIFLVQSYE